MGFLSRFFRGSVQHSIQVTLSPEARITDTKGGNPYCTYESQVLETARKYQGESDWGNQPTRNMVDVRASFTISGGVQVRARVADGDPVKELDAVREFMESNNLDREKVQKWAKEAEIEGKVLVHLFPDEKTKTIQARFIPWSQHKYKVTTDPMDYERYEGVTYTLNMPGGKTKEVNLGPDQFVFATFGGRCHNVEKTPTKIGGVLRHIESLDKALADWRSINHLFASPTPTFTMENRNAVEDTWQWIQGQNWKIGKTLVFSGGTFAFVSPGAEGVQWLLQEITFNAKIISGATGIPVQFLGLPDLMSNRSTAENLMELVTASTGLERKSWAGFYEELFRKALAMRAKVFNEALDPMAVSADITVDSATAAALVKDLWLPMRESEQISQATFLSKVPGIEPGEEMTRLEKEEKKRQEENRKMFGAGGGIRPFPGQAQDGQDPQNGDQGGDQGAGAPGGQARAQ